MDEVHGGSCGEPIPERVVADVEVVPADVGESGGAGQRAHMARENAEPRCAVFVADLEQHLHADANPEDRHCRLLQRPDESGITNPGHHRGHGTDTR